MVDGKEKYKFDLGVKELIFFFVVFFLLSISSLIISF